MGQAARDLDLAINNCTSLFRVCGLIQKEHTNRRAKFALKFSDIGKRLENVVLTQ